VARTLVPSTRWATTSTRFSIGSTWATGGLAFPRAEPHGGRRLDGPHPGVAQPRPGVQPGRGRFVCRPKSTHDRARPLVMSRGGRTGNVLEPRAIAATARASSFRAHVPGRAGHATPTGTFRPDRNVLLRLALRASRPLECTPHAMRYKYEADLDRCADQPCPSADYTPRQSKAYRYLHKPARVPANFKPPAYTPHPPHTPTCGSYALSFADTLENARKRYNSLKRRFREHTADRYGDHIGLIELTANDGA
jgi:hypothetical protein